MQTNAQQVKWVNPKIRQRVNILDPLTFQLTSDRSDGKD